MELNPDHSGAVFATGAVSMFTPISHQVLKSVDPVMVSTFLKEREQHELDVGQKKTASIDRTLLKHMVLLDEFDEIAPKIDAEDPTFDDVKTFIYGFPKKPTSGFKSHSIDKAGQGLQMVMYIACPESRVLHFVSYLFERLGQIGYGKFCTGNPKKVTELIFDHLAPILLRTLIHQHLEYDKGLQKDVKAF